MSLQIAQTLRDAAALKVGGVDKIDAPLMLEAADALTAADQALKDQATAHEGALAAQQAAHHDALSALAAGYGGEVDALRAEREALRVVVPAPVDPVA